MKYLHVLIFFLVSMTARAQVFDTLVLFETKSLLFATDDAEPILENTANWDSILQNASLANKIILEGHTDEVGSVPYNQNLSRRRVERVKDLLLAAGVSTEKIDLAAYGESRPVISGNEESSYQWNRRVSLEFLYLKKMRRVRGNIIDSESGAGLKAKVKLTGKNFVDSTMTNTEGNYNIVTPNKGIIKIEAIADGYFFEQQYIKISPLEPVEINLELPKLKIGGEYKLPNFNFKGNLPVLLDSSIPTLNQLYKLLSSNTFCIEIEGHINLPNQAPCDRRTRHYKLSVDRAQMVFNSMTKKGIDAKRMLPKGYGNWHMLFPNAMNEEEMRENRRVEIKIIDCTSEELLSFHNK